MLTKQKLFFNFFFYHYLVSSIRKFVQVFPVVRQLKLEATCLNGQVNKNVNVDPSNIFDIKAW